MTKVGKIQENILSMRKKANIVLEDQCDSFKTNCRENNIEGRDFPSRSDCINGHNEPNNNSTILKKRTQKKASTDEEQ